MARRGERSRGMIVSVMKCFVFLEFSLIFLFRQITYIINTALEVECRELTWIPGKSWKFTIYEDKIDNSMPADANSGTFMGRLARELIRVTDPRSVFSGWIEKKKKDKTEN